MDKILMENLTFYGYHGVLEEEKTLGQKFHINLSLYADLSQAGKTDQLEYTVNYAEVYELVKEIVENKRYDLIEALAENICDAILNQFNKITEIEILIKKPQAPVNGMFDYLGVQLRRTRND